MRFIIGLILGISLVFNYLAFSDSISSPPVLPADFPPQLVHYLQEIYSNFHRLEITTTSPDGNISGRVGRMIIYNNSGTYGLFINDDGDTSWQEI